MSGSVLNGENARRVVCLDHRARSGVDSTLLVDKVEDCDLNQGFPVSTRAWLALGLGKVFTSPGSD